MQCEYNQKTVLSDLYMYELYKGIQLFFVIFVFECVSVY